MRETCAVRSELPLPAISHVDGSARPQTDDRRHDSRFAALLEAFERRTRCPMLLNTSFNVDGEPIVCAGAPPLELRTRRRCRSYPLAAPGELPALLSTLRALVRPHSLWRRSCRGAEHQVKSPLAPPPRHSPKERQMYLTYYRVCPLGQGSHLLAAQYYLE
jgi:Carbamoyltransferase C-terminus